MSDDVARTASGRTATATVVGERRTPFEAIPGPSGVETIRIMIRTLRNDFTDGLSSVRREYGQPARLALPGSDVDGLVVSRPEHVECILETNQSNYRKPDVYFDMLSHLGESLVTSQGDDWREQHRLLMPMFQRKNVFGFTDVVLDQTEKLLDRWRSVADRGGTIDLREEMRRITLDIIGHTMFSTDVNEFSEEFVAASDALRTRMRRQQSPVPYPSWFLERRYREPVETLEAIAARLIRDRRGHEDEYDDLLTMMMTAQEEGADLSDERIVDNIITFLLAGHDTTALALTWTWYLLAQSPDIHRRVHETVADASDVTVRSFTPETVEEFGYVKQAIQEGMRLFPPVPFFTRETIEDDTIGDFEVPGGTTLLVSKFLTHRDSSIWDDPLVYRPERFHPDRAEERPRYSFYPFGGGARMCIGRTFALMEAQLILSLVAAELRLELESPRPGEEIDVSSAVTMAPGEQIRMSVHEWE